VQFIKAKMQIMDQVYPTKINLLENAWK